MVLDFVRANVGQNARKPWFAYGDLVIEHIIWLSNRVINYVFFVASGWFVQCVENHPVRNDRNDNFRTKTWIVHGYLAT